MPEALLDGTLPDRMDWFGVWLLGVSMGLTACTVTCVPYLGSWVLEQAYGARRTSQYGRVSARAHQRLYATRRTRRRPERVARARAGRSRDKGHATDVLIAVASIASGLWLLGPGPAAHTSCTVARRGGSAAPFVLGFALSAAPCAPLAALLAACA